MRKEENSENPVLSSFKKLIKGIDGLKVVIIDMLGSSSIMDGIWNYNYFKENKLMHQLHLLALELNISIIVVHHTRKQKSDDFTDNVSGTTGLIGPDASTWVLESPRFSNQCSLKVTGKYQGTKSYQLEFDEQLLELRYVGDKIILELPPARQAIVDVFLKYPEKDELPSSFIAKDLGKSIQTISKTLRRMRKKGIVEYGKAHGCYRLAGHLRNKEIKQK